MPTMKSTEPAMQDSVSSRVAAQGAVFIQCHGDSTIRAIFDQLLKLGASKWLTESSAVLVPTEKL